MVRRHVEAARSWSKHEWHYHSISFMFIANFWFGRTILDDLLAVMTCRVFELECECSGERAVINQLKLRKLRIAMHGFFGCVIYWTVFVVEKIRLIGVLGSDETNQYLFYLLMVDMIDLEWEVMWFILCIVFFMLLLNVSIRFDFISFDTSCSFVLLFAF